MKTLKKVTTAKKLKVKGLKFLDEISSQGIVFTKKSQHVATVSPLRRVDNSNLIGSMKGKVTVTGKLLSTGRKWKAQS